MVADPQPPLPDRDDARDTRSTLLATLAVMALSAAGCCLVSVLYSGLYLLMVLLGMPVN